MPLNKAQTEILKTGLAKSFPGENCWTTEAEPNGDCIKLVVVLKGITKQKLRELLDLSDAAGCDLNQKMSSQGINVRFD